MLVSMAKLCYIGGKLHESSSCTTCLCHVPDEVHSLVLYWGLPGTAEMEAKKPTTKKVKSDRKNEVQVKAPGSYRNRSGKEA